MPVVKSEGGVGAVVERYQLGRLSNLADSGFDEGGRQQAESRSPDDVFRDMGSPTLDHGPAEPPAALLPKMMGADISAARCTAATFGAVIWN